MLKGKKILLGISGSIAAYKMPFLVRLLKKEGAEVTVILTPTAFDFVTPLTLSTLSENEVLSDPYDKKSGRWTSHVNLGITSNLYLIAPASAATLSKLAHGLADNLLTTTYLASRCPVFIAPAMDVDMFRHPATQENIEILRKRGHLIIDPGEGDLASGLKGAGRLEDPENILKIIKDFFLTAQRLNGKKILITAGPTYEPIDPVRFIGNYSSGKMGVALAEEAASMGAETTLICGPMAYYPESKWIKVIKVQTAQQMLEACLEHFPQNDVAIKAAAVADFTPETVEEEKIKKQKNTTPEIKLKSTVDILAQLGKQKRADQVLIGFALETEHVFENAEKKLREKNLDFIVVNDAKKSGAGFNVDTNIITILYSDGKKQSFEQKQKRLVARDILLAAAKVL
ncbi:MAG: bifunctional phosphopantothenoylcysteine decarboxylase/phosphopantothenate--cysteine ligase CoaBC [Bacteroidales bacterium]|jgi:phosphopantothenoylcysteine decarboxylase/phosphopantothenate--cysteine ligase|nr:bifunctional phosphopantothenoylcysteine decarboxylase/phosphopantothenate--cysteine ligase CoaBC [Bacteroidales bacterium]